MFHVPAFASAWYGKIIRPSSWAAAFQLGFYELDLKKKKINKSDHITLLLKTLQRFPTARGDSVTVLGSACQARHSRPLHGFLAVAPASPCPPICLL